MIDVDDNGRTIETINKCVITSSSNMSSCIEFLQLMKEIDLSGKVSDVDLTSIQEKYDITIEQLNSAIKLLHAMESVIKTQTERLSMYQTAFKKSTEDIQKLIKPK